MVRTTITMIAAGLALAVVGAGCSGKSGDAGPPRTVSITMERTPCFGSCPVYRLDLDGTGKVVFDGRGFVKVRGQREGTVPAAEVQALAKEIESAGYFTFKDHYPPAATDNPSVITSVTIDGKTKRIEHNLSARSAPAALEALYLRIDEVAGAKQWIGESPTAPRPGEKGGGPDTARKDTSAR